MLHLLTIFALFIGQSPLSRHISKKVLLKLSSIVKFSQNFYVAKIIGSSTTSLVCTALIGSLHNLWCGLLSLPATRQCEKPHYKVKTISSHTLFFYPLSSGNWRALNYSLHMEKKELWYEMLTTYCRLMRYENGITLPNMIGAYYSYDSSIDLSSSQCVIRVLNDILSSPKNVGVLINKCNNIHNYILSITDRSLNNPNISDKIFVGLYDSNLQTTLPSVNELGEYIYSLYREEIINKKFSVTDGIWNPLSDIEIGHINDIIKSF